MANKYLANLAGKGRSEIVADNQRLNSTLSNARKKTQQAGQQFARMAVTGVSTLGTAYAVSRFGDDDEGAKIAGFPAEAVAGALVGAVGFMSGSKHILSVAEGIGYAYLAKVGAVLGAEHSEA